ncbi:hypothetical protein B0H12DRAFT_1241237 [Mycena haematopus]|nr:hypothetical protein B0H12DRAFT_1241237 [Mycena haematopus]
MSRSEGRADLAPCWTLSGSTACAWTWEESSVDGEAEAREAQKPSYSRAFGSASPPPAPGPFWGILRILPVTVKSPPPPSLPRPRARSSRSRTNAPHERTMGTHGTGREPRLLPACTSARCIATSRWRPSSARAGAAVEGAVLGERRIGVGELRAEAAQGEGQLGDNVFVLVVGGVGAQDSELGGRSASRSAVRAESAEVESAWRCSFMADEWDSFCVFGD